jgi:hypothetical protein
MSYWTWHSAADNRLMQKASRNVRRQVRSATLDGEPDFGSQSYFQWREKTVRMPAVTVTAKPQSSSLVRFFRRIFRKSLIPG